jgi:hypothetical protein
MLPSEFIERYGTLLSIAAMILGVLAVISGVTHERTSADLLPGEAARVNGRAIDSDTFQRTVAGFVSSLKRPATPADRAMILNRLIDEEVLVQRAIELGLPQQDPTVRKQLVQAMIGQAVAQGSQGDPSDDELKRYIAANAELFRARARAKVDALFVPGGDAARSAAVTQALAKGDWEGARSLGVAPPVAIPDDFLIASKIADYAGSQAASAVLRMPVGHATKLMPISGGAIALKLVAAEGEGMAPFAEIRAAALARWREERDAKSLRAAIDALRAQSEIVTPK